MTDILVLDTPFEPGWNGDPNEVPASHLLVPSAEAWEADWATDAHCVQYFIPGEEHMPRLNKSSVAWLRTHHNIDPLIGWVLVDVDNPDHGEWTEDLEAQLADTLSPDNLPEVESAGFYMTKHGYRLVWRLPEPMSALLFEDWASMFYTYLRSKGVNADPACKDWTRLYRMPRATRDGTLQDLPYDFTNTHNGSTLDWQPPRSPVEGQAPMRKEVRTWEPGTEIPDIPTKTLIRDVTYLKDTEWYQPIINRRALAQSGERNAKTISALGSVLARMEPEPDPYLAFKLLAPCVDAQVIEGSSWDTDWLWEKCLLFANREQGQREYKQDLYNATIGVRHLLQKEAAEEMGLSEAPDEADDPSFIRKLVLTPPGLNVVYMWDTRLSRYERVAFHPMTLARDLSKACGHQSLDGDGIPLISLRDDKGKLLPGSEIMHRYSSGVKRSVFRYTPGTSYDDVTGTLTTTLTDVHPQLKPEFNKEVDDWLDMLGGDNAWRIKDWLSVLFQYDYPVCALYLEGAPGVGKGLLVESLAQIWSGKFCGFSELTKAFDQRILETPLIWADEIAEGAVGKSMSAAFRKIVGSSVHDVSVKYESNMELHGCPRVMITANNSNAIRFMENMSGDDIEAVVTRFGHVMCNPETEQYLLDLGGRRHTLDWSKGLGIANHVAWMNENYVLPEKTGRYLIPGWARDFAENLVAHGSMQGEVQDAIVRYLTAHVVKGQPIKGMCTWHEGSLGVNTTVLQDSWSLLMGDKAKVPSRSQINKTAKSLCHGHVRKRTKTGQSLRYRLVKMDSLVRYAEQVLDIDAEEMTKAFKRIEKEETDG